LGLVTGITLIAFGQLVATGGRPALLTLVQRQPDVFGSVGPEELTGSIILSFLWTLPGTVVAAGWPLARSFPAALERLGFVRPSRRQVLGGVLVAGAMVAVLQGLDVGLTALWNVTGWPKTDVKAFEQLLKPLITPQGALIIGITAGVGEELLVRGVLQPRLGIVLSNLFFTSLHAFQYGFDGLLSVFMAGMVLGVVRARTNTSTSAIVHGTYDFILVMGAALTAGASV
jgi:membrane protease YdiL (CAAX protease family)